MYIMKRLSRGRGEYELAESFGEISAGRLAGLRLRFNFGPYGVRSTGLKVSEQGGKLRLRIESPPAIHVQRQIEAALLLPKSIRDEDRLPGGLPTIMLNRYILRRIVFGNLVLHTDSADVSISSLELSNGTATADEVNFDQRMQRVANLHQSASRIAQPVAQLLNEHRQMLQSPSPFPRSAEKLVESLMRTTANIAPDYNVDYLYGTDVLAVLEEILEIPTLEQPTSINSFAPDEVEVRRREAEKWRRWAIARGSESAVFRRNVRTAYSSRCVVCGLRLPQSACCRIPGVDSAHILPWADFDLDVVSNGLCLCKNHHWAFDQQLIAIRFDGANYQVAVTHRAQEAFREEPDTLNALRIHEGQISEDRLPRNRSDWPSAQFLSQLYDDVPDQ